MKLAGSRFIAVTVAVMTIAAPGPSQASAPGPQRMYVNPSTGFATPAAAIGHATAGPRPEVHPNPDEQSGPAGLIAPPALRTARPSELAALHRAEAKQHEAAVYSPPSDAGYSAAVTNAYRSAAPQVAAVTPPIVTHDGFRYRDAAIGAGVAAAIMSLLAAGAMAVRRRGRFQHS
jgi:hypothetical protein